MKVVVIGAGIGGLTVAAVLARAGADVTVLENHIYPGGCAGTFYHRDYLFDAGATVAGGFYAGGPMHQLGAAVGIEDWGGHVSQATMTVTLPDGLQVTRWADNRRWVEREAAFGESGLRFWQQQETVADHLWRLAELGVPFPPQTVREMGRLVASGLKWASGDIRSLALTRWLGRKVADTLSDSDRRLRLFVDAQLLIAAQTTSEYTDALFGAAALDLPKRGVRHFEGGMGTVAKRLADAVETAGGRVLYKQRADHIRMEGGRPIAVEMRRRGKVGSFPADVVVANLTPPDLQGLLPAPNPRLQRAIRRGGRSYGAFVVHAGVPASLVAGGEALHHQVVCSTDLREGRSVFVSVSPSWDRTRAPAGSRAVTISTHTKLQPWWDLLNMDNSAYEQMKRQYGDKLLRCADRVFPGLAEQSGLMLAGSPVTYNRFTSRTDGWVGGFPQESLRRLCGPFVQRGVWMVGDTIFPGQSTAAVALGGMRTARAILDTF